MVKNNWVSFILLLGRLELDIPIQVTKVAASQPVNYAIFKDTPLPLWFSLSLF